MGAGMHPWARPRSDPSGRYLAAGDGLVQGVTADEILEVLLWLTIVLVAVLGAAALAVARARAQLRYEQDEFYRWLGTGLVHEIDNERRDW